MEEELRVWICRWWGLVRALQHLFDCIGMPQQTEFGQEWLRKERGVLGLAKAAIVLGEAGGFNVFFRSTFFVGTVWEEALDATQTAALGGLVDELDKAISVTLFLDPN